MAQDARGFSDDRQASSARELALEAGDGQAPGRGRGKKRKHFSTGTEFSDGDTVHVCVHQAAVKREMEALVPPKKQSFLSTVVVDDDEEDDDVIAL